VLDSESGSEKMCLKSPTKNIQTIRRENISLFRMFGTARLLYAVRVRGT